MPHSKPDLLIDLTRLLGRLLDGHIPSGIDRVALAYVQHYGHRARAFVYKGSQWAVFSHKHSQLLYAAIHLPTAPKKSRLHHLIAQGVLFNRLECGIKDSILINVNHTGLESAAYCDILRRLRLRPVYMLHDLIPISHPEYCRPHDSQRHQQRLSAILATAQGVITNSHSTLQSFQRYAMQQGKTSPPCVATSLGTPSLTYIGYQPPLLTQPYFVMLSTIEPRKNHWLILHIWRELAVRLGEQVPQLVIIGRRGWECENILDLLERSPALQHTVLELSECRDDDLGNYLHFAQALLFPSFTEGYGLPIAEALQIGTPVIASDLPVFREFAGDIPEYLSPIDGIGWLNAIIDYTSNDHPRRIAQLTRLKIFETPSWETHFTIIDSFIDSLKKH